jgi:pimeloyl-ACP methyl ester carboxylesterase
VDLPHHGISPPGAHDDTVSGLAADVDAWLTAQNLTPDALLGHSYGGKVALALAAHRADRPLQVWVVDSTPESKAPGGSAWDMLRLVRELPETFASREEAADAIAHAGFSLGVAQWMTTNLERQSGRFAWRLDFDVMERLLHDFFTADFWHVVDPPAAGHVVHVIKASESSVISPEALARLEQQESRVQVHHRAGGHWIHAESPEVITALLTQYLP